MKKIKSISEGISDKINNSRWKTTLIKHAIINIL